ncbi:hypothetical protein HYX16_02295 [Candidatus Woesearchaeota archaeon]|nr:hypothetical protein [Candidatus Woesearchaeota archaeon]
MASTCLINPGLILYILLGAIVGIIYSLRRIFRLEKLMLSIDEKIENKLGIRGGGEMAARRRAAASKAKASRKRRR